MRALRRDGNVDRSVRARDRVEIVGALRVRHGKVVGIITRIDVLKLHLQAADGMTDELERYISGNYPG